MRPRMAWQSRHAGARTRVAATARAGGLNAPPWRVFSAGAVGDAKQRLSTQQGTAARRVAPIGRGGGRCWDGTISNETTAKNKAQPCDSRPCQSMPNQTMPCPASYSRLPSRQRARR
eukprot:62319-Chlamydomonas_euryale.AAC.5